MANHEQSRSVEEFGRGRINAQNPFVWTLANNGNRYYALDSRAARRLQKRDYDRLVRKEAKKKSK